MTQHLQITPLIGKRSLHNSWLVQPPPVGTIHDKLQAALQSNLTVRVRIREALQDPAADIASEVLTMAGHCISQIRAKGTCRVVLQRGEIDPANNRHKPAIVETYEVGKIYEVSAAAAFRLLNATPYLYIFEEVLGGSTQQTTRAGGAEASALAELQEQNRHLMERLAALEAAQSTKSTTKKRTLKDTLAANAEADAANEEG